MSSKLQSDRQIIADLGGPQTFIDAGYSAEVVKKWQQRGIAWRERPKVLEIAEEKGIPLPKDFLLDRHVGQAPKKKAA